VITLVLKISYECRMDEGGCYANDEIFWSLSYAFCGGGSDSLNDGAFSWNYELRSYVYGLSARLKRNLNLTTRMTRNDGGGDASNASCAFCAFSSYVFCAAIDLIPLTAWLSEAPPMGLGPSSLLRVSI